MNFIFLVLVLILNFSGRFSTALADTDNCDTHKGYDFALKSQGQCVLQKYLIQIASNDRATAAGDTEHYSLITLEEQQEWIRFVHNYKIEAMDLLKLKTSLREQEAYGHLSSQAKSEIEKTFYDAIKISEIMETYRQGGSQEFAGTKMHCRFALRNSPMEEVPRSSIFISPKRYTISSKLKTNNLLRPVKAGEKVMVGLCWDNKSNDRYSSY